MLKIFNTSIYVASDHLSDKQAEEYGIEKMEMNDIFSYCDIISIHLAQNEKNYHIISSKQFDLIKEGALFVNTSRGSIVDENALYKSMKNKKFYSVLDVYEQEPLPMDSKLRTLDNIITIPHMAGPTIDKRKYVTTELINEIKKVLNNENSYLNITRETMHHMTK